MKQINYLLLATILFFSNCSKDNGVDEILSEEIVNITEADLITEADSITEADLVGNWDFVSLEFEGKTYTDCNNELSRNYNLLNLSFLNVTLKSELYDKPTLIYFSKCDEINDNEINDKEISFKIKDKKIILNDNDNYAYLLLNFHDFDGDTLKIKSLLKTRKAPTGGIYTLKKSTH